MVRGAWGKVLRRCRCIDTLYGNLPCSRCSSHHMDKCVRKSRPAATGWSHPSLPTCILFSSPSPSVSFPSSPIASSASVTTCAANDLFENKYNAGWETCHSTNKRRSRRCLHLFIICGGRIIIISRLADLAPGLLLIPRQSWIQHF